MDTLRRDISSSPPVPSSPSELSNQLPPESSSPTQGTPIPPSNPRKRSFQEFGQYALSVSRSMKLPKTDSDELTRFAKLDSEEKLIWLAAYSLKMAGNQALASAPNVVYNLPKALENNIDHYSFVVLMDPTIAAYINTKIGPAVILQGLLEEHPSWGLTPAVKADKTKFDTIMARVRDKLTKRRAEMKKVLARSMGTEDHTQEAEPGEPLPRIGAQNIVELCEELVDIYKRADMAVSVPLCARVAFLRHVLKLGNGANYWDTVDTELKSTRDALLDKSKQSKFFQKILDLDRNTYGQAQLAGIPLSTPSQLPTASTANGSASDD